jgi:hypothetical protein
MTENVAAVAVVAGLKDKVEVEEGEEEEDKGKAAAAAGSQKEKQAKKVGKEQSGTALHRRPNRRCGRDGTAHCCALQRPTSDGGTLRTTSRLLQGTSLSRNSSLQRAVISMEMEGGRTALLLAKQH